ncbi:hypothetical protein F2Q69_00005706 [Brassica cretica]|uniref:Uncharacterized protein n=1 Tax=Brassica cretica TaxID=69181 RepID=A0A8S9NWB0_BRACR|nr:hypothetical protein F2Q69_00005706 [Brassica cretica]
MISTRSSHHNININGQSSSNNLASPRHQECIQDHNSATYEKDERSLSRAQHLPAGFTTLTNSKSWHTKQPLRRGYNASEYLSNSIGVVPRKEPCPSAGNTAALLPAKEPEKMLSLQQGVLVLIPSTHLGQRGVKEAGEHMFPLLFIQKKKPNIWVPGPSFQVPDRRFQIFGCSPYKEVKPNDSTKKQAPTTLLPLFLAMYPDILLKEAKATCFSRFPRLHVSRGMHLYKLLKK